MPRIAWFSPFSNSRQLRSAHFTSAVLSRAPKSWDIEIFVDDKSFSAIEKDSDGEANFLGFPVFLYHRAFLRHEKTPFDAFCFQREDSAEATFIEEMMRVWPGVVFYHDMSSTELESSRLAHATTSDAVVERAKELGGGDQALLGDLKARGWETEMMERGVFDCSDSLRNVVVAAPSVSRFVDDISSKGMAVNIASVGFPMKCVKEAARRLRSEALRKSLGIDADAVVISSIVRYPLEDRLRIAVEAVAEILKKRAASGRKVFLLWISETTKDFQLAGQLHKRVCRDLPEAENFIVRVNAEDFGGVLELLDAADIHNALKFSLVRGFPIDFYGALARGLPTLVSRFGNAVEIPDSAVCKISVGHTEQREFVAAVEAILSDRSFRNELRRQAQAFIETVCDPGAVLADLQSIVEQYLFEMQAAVSKQRDDIRANKLGQLTEAGCLSGVDGESMNKFLIEAAEDFGWQVEVESR